MTSNRKNNNSQTTDTVDVSSLILTGILGVIRTQKEGQWTGTMTKLSSALTRTLGRSSIKHLPKSPSALRVSVNKVLGRLRKGGVSVKFSRSSDHTRTRLVEFVTR